MAKVIRITRKDAHGRTITKTRRTRPTQPNKPRPAPPGGAARRPVSYCITDVIGEAA